MRWLLLAPAASTVLAAATDFNPYLTLINLGVAGVGLWAFMTGRIHNDGDYQGQVKRAEAAEAALAESNTFIRGEMASAMLRVAESAVRSAERKTR